MKIKHTALLLAIALCAIATPHAQNSTTRFFIACEYENLTVDATAGGVAFTEAEYEASACGGGAASVTFSIACDGGGSSCPIRMVLDPSTTVTSSVGVRADYAQTVTIYSITNITNFRAIREGATSAILNVQYFR